MIVDDRLTILGSANINDRSMLGYRDSEIDVIIEDQERIAGKMNGKPHKVGEFSHSLRCRLIKEHLGILKGLNVDIDVSDPISQHFLKNLTKTATRNTRIYEDKNLRRWKRMPKGHIVTFPRIFLSEYSWLIYFLEFLPRVLAKPLNSVMNGPPRIESIKTSSCTHTCPASFIEYYEMVKTLDN